MILTSGPKFTHLPIINGPFNSQFTPIPELSLIETYFLNIAPFSKSTFIPTLFIINLPNITLNVLAGGKRLDCCKLFAYIVYYTISIFPFMIS
jgi:hypothetical protein